MVWIVIIFSEIFWFKSLLVNSNLMFACLSGYSLGFATDRRGNCQEGSLHFSMSSFGVTLSSCYENSWDICCSLQTFLSWAYIRDRQIAISPLQNLWLALRDALAVLLRGSSHCGIYFVQNIK